MFEDSEKFKEKISFFLFQMPSNFSPSEKNIENIGNFFSKVDLGNSAAVLEFRDPEWWKQRKVCEDLGVVFCSVDAPGLPRDIIAMNKAVYLRLHGRGESWYSYTYSQDELASIVLRLKRNARKAPRGVYVYLNNDEGMLPNGFFLMEKLVGIRTSHL